MPIDILWQPTTSSSNLFYCPSCDALLEQANRRAQYVVCGNCGSEIDVGMKSYEVIHQHILPKKFKLHSFIRIGQKVFINGKHHKVIARKNWKINYKQYVEVEGPNYYEERFGSFDEWILMGEDGTYITFLEDASGYFLKEKIIPEIPMIMQGDLLLRFFANHHRQIVRKHGKAELRFYEGEKNRRIPSDQEKLLAFYEENGTYGVECGLDEKDKTIKKVSFYQLKEIGLRSFYDSLLPNEQKDKLKRKQRSWIITMFITLLATIFFFWLGFKLDQSGLMADLFAPTILILSLTGGYMLLKEDNVWGFLGFALIILPLPFIQLISVLNEIGQAGIWIIFAFLGLSFFIFCLWKRKYKLIR